VIERRRGFTRLVSYGIGFLKRNRHILLSIAVGAVAIVLAFNVLEGFANQKGLGYWIYRSISPVKNNLARESVLVVYNPFLTGEGSEFFASYQGISERRMWWAVMEQIKASVLLRVAESIIVGIVCGISSELAIDVYVDRKSTNERCRLTRARLLRLQVYFTVEAVGLAIIVSKLLKFVSKPAISYYPYLFLPEPVLNSLDWTGLALAAVICSAPFIVEFVRYCRSRSPRKGISFLTLQQSY